MRLFRVPESSSPNTVDAGGRQSKKTEILGNTPVVTFCGGPVCRDTMRMHVQRRFSVLNVLVP